MINIYDNVNAVAADLRETAQYKTLRDAVEALNADAAAKDVFQRFQAAKCKSTKQCKLVKSQKLRKLQNGKKLLVRWTSTIL